MRAPQARIISTNLFSIGRTRPLKEAGFDPYQAALERERGTMIRGEPLSPQQTQEIDPMKLRQARKARRAFKKAGEKLEPKIDPSAETAVSPPPLDPAAETYIDPEMAAEPVAEPAPELRSAVAAAAKEYGTANKGFARSLISRRQQLKNAAARSKGFNREMFQAQSTNTGRLLKNLYRATQFMNRSIRDFNSTTRIHTSREAALHMPESVVKSRLLCCSAVKPGMVIKAVVKKRY